MKNRVVRLGRSIAAMPSVPKVCCGEAAAAGAFVVVWFMRCLVLLRGGSAKFPGRRCGGANPRTRIRPRQVTTL
ncbi:hypothetical protein SKB0092_03780 [Roseomonas mucosa]